MTGQLAGAMKTASAVKYARTSATLARFLPRASACRAMKTRFGSALGTALPCADPDAPRCFVLLGSNRGLCGGYNIALYEFADRIFEEAGDFTLIAAGRHALNRLRETGVGKVPPGEDAVVPENAFLLPDIPSFEDAAPLLERAAGLYRRGEVSSVELIGQEFVNMLTQKPVLRRLLPMDTPDGEQTAVRGRSAEDVLYVPDRETVLHSAAEAVLASDFYAFVLETAAGAQAATLVAMRTASDNAEKTASDLESAISRLRQSQITSGVIETAGGNAGRREED